MKRFDPSTATPAQLFAYRTGATLAGIFLVGVAALPFAVIVHLIAR